MQIPESRPASRPVFEFAQSVGENPGAGVADARAFDNNTLPVRHSQRSDSRPRSRKLSRLPREMPRCECGGDCAVCVPDVGPVTTLCIACGKEGVACR